jgi:hypothetical protein
MHSCANYDEKLSTLARYEGLSVDALLEACATDSVSPGICRKPPPWTPSTRREGAF